MRRIIGAEPSSRERAASVSRASQAKLGKYIASLIPVNINLPLGTNRKKTKRICRLALDRCRATDLNLAFRRFVAHFFLSFARY